MAAPATSFADRPPPAHGFRSLERVSLLADVADAAGTIPAGSHGTIVHCYAGGEGFEIEFARPRHAVVTVRRSQIAPL